METSIGACRCALRSAGPARDARDGVLSRSKGLAPHGLGTSLTAEGHGPARAYAGVAHPALRDGPGLHPVALRPPGAAPGPRVPDGPGRCPARVVARSTWRRAARWPARLGVTALSAAASTAGALTGVR
jgi:hypothetical protein